MTKFKWYSGVLLLISTVSLLSCETPLQKVSTTTGALRPLNDSHCVVMDKVMKRTIFPSDFCITLLLDYIDCPLHVTDNAMVTMTLAKLFNGHLAKVQSKFFCDKALILFEDWKLMKHFMVGRDMTKKYHPYTRLVFMSRSNSPEHGIIFDEAHQRQILLGTLHVYYGRIVTEDSYELVDVLSKEVIPFHSSSSLEARIRSIRNFLIHPLFDTKSKKNEVNVSLYHCDPFVIQLNDKKTKESYDGVEYRFLLESTKGWNVRMVDCSDLIETGDPWAQVANDVADGTTNFALCSAWLTEHLIKRFDVTGYSSNTCGTFLVPKPAPIALASYLYYPLEDEVWIVIFSFLIFTALLYHCFIRILSTPSVGQWCTNQRTNIKVELETLGRSFLDIVNIITSHGLPRIMQRTPIQILIVSWLFLSFLLCTAYSTKLMSVLARPLFSKAVDTVQEFIKEDLFWGEIGERESMKGDLIVSGNPEYIELARRLRVEKNLAERYRNIEGGNYARFVKTLTNNYVMDTETITNYSHHFRLMKSCVNEYYTVFPFDKKSPYTRYFNMKLGRFAQAGIIKYWLGMMSTKYGKSFMRSFFEKDKKVVTIDPKPYNMGNFVGAFYVLGIGLSMALGVFLIEIYVHKRRSTRILEL